MQNFRMENINTEGVYDNGFLVVDAGTPGQNMGVFSPVLEGIAQDTNRGHGYYNVYCITTGTPSSCVQNGAIYGVFDNGVSAIFGTTKTGSLNTEEANLHGVGEVTLVGGTFSGGNGFAMGSYPRGGQTILGNANILGSDLAVVSPGGVQDIGFAQILPPPKWASVPTCGAGGSLPPGTYYYKIRSMDSSGGESLPGLEQSVTCSSGGSKVTMPLQDLMGHGASCYRVHRGSSPGLETVYLNASSACGGSTSVAFEFSSGGVTDTGSITATTGSPPSVYSGAYYTALGFDANNWIAAGVNGAPYQPVGIGTTCKDAGSQSCSSLGIELDVKGGAIRGQGGIEAGTDKAFNASPRGTYNAFLPNLTSKAVTYRRMTLDKAITVMRFQLVLGTAGAGCTMQAAVSVTDGITPITLTTANGTAIYDSGGTSQNYAAGANLDIKIATAAGCCTTAPQNANVAVQYRMQ